MKGKQIIYKQLFKFWKGNILDLINFTFMTHASFGFPDLGK